MVFFSGRDGILKSVVEFFLGPAAQHLFACACRHYSLSSKQVFQRGGFPEAARRRRHGFDANLRSGRMREIPFGLAAGPDGSAPNPADDPMDQVMIRGRIDLLVPVDGKVSVVDYKTDHVTGPEITFRAQTYGNQMRLYRQAIEQVARQTIDSVYLVFLNPRQILRF